MDYWNPTSSYFFLVLMNLFMFSINYEFNSCFATAACLSFLFLSGWQLQVNIPICVEISATLRKNLSIDFCFLINS